MALLNRGSVLVLETFGRRTGMRRSTSLGYWKEGDAFLVGGGAAGMATVPDWVRNLRANPYAAVWVHRTRIAVVADEIVGDARDRAQEDAVKIWPGVARYASRPGRVVPYFRLEPLADPV